MMNCSKFIFIGRPLFKNSNRPRISETNTSALSAFHFQMKIHLLIDLKLEFRAEIDFKWKFHLKKNEIKILRECCTSIHFKFLEKVSVWLFCHSVPSAPSEFFGEKKSTARCASPLEVSTPNKRRQWAGTKMFQWSNILLPFIGINNKIKTFSKIGANSSRVIRVLSLALQ